MMWGSRVSVCVVLFLHLAALLVQNCLGQYKITQNDVLFLSPVQSPIIRYANDKTEAGTTLKLSNGSSVLISSLDEYLDRITASNDSREKSRPIVQTNRSDHGVSNFGSPSTPATLLVGASSNASSTKPIPQHWQVKGLLNVTHDYPLAYSQIICGYIWPLMALITMFTNLMIVFILTQRDMRTPTNVVLTAIAIADIIPIVVPVPWFVYLFAMGNEQQVLYPPLTCYMYQHSTRSVSEVFYFLSTWLNLLLAVQDYLTAAWPKLAKKYCQIRVVIVEILLLTLLAFLLNLPQALKIIFKPVKFYYKGQLTWGCRALQAKWFKDLVGEYVALYDDIFTAIIVLFVDGGPAVALITLTALLIRQLHKQRIQGHLLMEQARTASKRRRERHRQQEYEASARVMIFVLLAFLAVKIPFATTYTLMIIQSRFDIHFVENLVDFQKAITITDLVFVLSYPLNFTIFCCCSKKFRHKCVQLLAECNDGASKSRLMRSFSESFYSDSQSLATSKRQSVLDCPDHDAQLLDKLHSNATFPTVDYSKPDLHLDVSDEQELQAIAAEGKLCLECILRYEKIKKSPSSSTRRESVVSSQMSWPPAPPPPLLHLHQYSQLPQIITTRCESIVESSPQQSGDEALVDAGKEIGEQPVSFDCESSSISSTHTRSSRKLSREVGTASLYQPLATKHSNQPEPSSQWPQLDPVTERRSSGDDEHKRNEPRSKHFDEHHDNTLARQRNLASSSSSDSASHSKRRLSPFNHRSGRLSLSLSNSKLSTLPNATGLLADILVTSLLGHNPRAKSHSGLPLKGKTGKR